jgi:transcriptional regulator with XRE-family HTH domain
MIDEDAESLIGQLKTLVGERRGSQSEIARSLGVTRQRLNDWLTGRSTPTLNAGLKLQAFLKKHRRRTRKIEKNDARRNDKAG